MRINSIFLLAFLCVLFSCSNLVEDNAIYHIDSGDRTVCVLLDDWKVTGPFTLERDSIIRNDAVSVSGKASLTANPDTTVGLWHNGVYHPLYGQLDLREVFNISVGDTTRTLDSTAVYLSCTIRSSAEKVMFLYVITEMKCDEYVNGDSLQRIDVNDMEIYPVRLRAGDNLLTVRAQGMRRRYFYDASLLDSASMAHLYAEEHTGNIIHPIISDDTITLTADHQSVTETPVKLTFLDVNGRNVAETALRKGVINYGVRGLQRGHAYICCMSLCGDTVRQPVMTLSLERADAIYKEKRDSLPDSHPRAEETDQLLYRLWKLRNVSEKMRSDKWYAFKHPWPVYQLEHIFSHLDNTYGSTSDENNLKFITYTSKLDKCPQRYILVTPNNIDRNYKYPLVVVVRPQNEKRHHLFSSPQIAHQPVVNDMQAVANKYKMFVIIPEARMLKDESMTPFAEAEMLLAINDAQEHYNIDASRIYLHANCSGGSRALPLAVRNPGLFAAIALYAPTYSNDVASKAVLKKLRHTPLLVFGDPVDTHSPVSSYASLLKDCDDSGVLCTFELRRNSGQGYHGYHRLIVGREACEFFKGKKSQNKTHVKSEAHPKDTTVDEFYARPFVYVYNSADTSKAYRQLVDSICEEYETYLYARLPLDTTKAYKMPMLPDTAVTKTLLSAKNVFLVGDNFGDREVKIFADKVKKSVDSRAGGISLSAAVNPYNRAGMALLYTSEKGPHFKNLISYPWMKREKRIVIEEDKK